MKKIICVACMVIDYKTEAGDNWERIEGTSASLSQVFYYKDILLKDANKNDVGVYGDSTTPIFTTVKVGPEATSEQIKALEDMGGFAIWIEGFAVQSTVSENYDGFKTWGMNDGVVFNNTPTADAPANVVKPGIVPAA